SASEVGKLLSRLNVPDGEIRKGSPIRDRQNEAQVDATKQSPAKETGDAGGKDECSATGRDRVTPLQVPG
ncbi:unnamed protein product, partial [Amoebophrya sp. A25]